MLRVAILAVVIVGLASPASARVVVHATSAAGVARDVAHEKLLQQTLMRALGPREDALVVDVSLVVMRSEVHGRDLRVNVEVRGVISDASGKARAAVVVRAAVRGDARDRAAMQREAIVAAAEQLAARLRRS